MAKILRVCASQTFFVKQPQTKCVHFSQRRQENGKSGGDGAAEAAEAGDVTQSSQVNQQRLKIDGHLHQLANVAEVVETICLRLLAPCVDVSK